MAARQGALAAALAVLACAPPAAAAEPLVFELALTARDPGAATGLRAHIVYPDYGGQPKQQARLAVELPAGTRFDESVVPACTATDEELASRGLSACPPESEVGTGTGSIASPFGPLAGDIHILHAPGELVNAATLPGSDRVVVVARGAIEGNRLLYDTSDDYPPPTPGQPPGKEVEQSVEPHTSAGRGFMTAPPGCPADGLWRSRFTVGYADGTSDTGRSTTPCRRPGAAAMRLTVRPREVRAGRRARFRFRVHSTEPRCRRASIAFAGARLVAGARGRAALVRRFRRSGERTARATAPGCSPARATVTVAP